MKTKLLTAVVIAASLIGSASAFAEEAAIKADEQCLAFGLYFAGQKKKDVREYGLMTTYYFLGRLEARAAGAVTPADFAAFLETLSEADILAQGDRCLEEFEAATGLLDQSTGDQAPKP